MYTQNGSKRTLALQNILICTLITMLSILHLEQVVYSRAIIGEITRALPLGIQVYVVIHFSALAFYSSAHDDCLAPMV